MTPQSPDLSRIIAFYLPQYHPIPENDQWWGKGFTEWTNVTKAKPLFKGHHQPQLPADLGFYDLRTPETREAQANLARRYGIHGFCYWHYWFSGKNLLEEPFQKVLSSGSPDYPFCLSWANATWTGIWHGCPERILIEQTYPGKEDYKNHFEYILPAFCDNRYITVDNKPLFIVYMPEQLPSPIEFTDLWRDMAVKAGLKGLYLVGIAPNHDWNPLQKGFDAAIPHNPGITFNYLTKHRASIVRRIKQFMKKPSIFQYENYIRYALQTPPRNYNVYPCVVPNWDNTPRCNHSGYILQNSTPELFRDHLTHALKQVETNDPNHKIVFIKSWNEWAEGNYLEPDQRYGHAYLQAVQDALKGNDTP